METPHAALSVPFTRTLQSTINDQHSTILTAKTYHGVPTFENQRFKKNDIVTFNEACAVWDLHPTPHLPDQL